MSSLRLIFWDQLSLSLASLKACNKATDTILMSEVMAEASIVKHHKKKIAFLFAAMRHFAEELRSNGYQVVYTKLDDENNKGTFSGEIDRVLQNCSIDNIALTQPGEYRLLQEALTWEKEFEIPVHILPDNRFLSTPEEFAHWAKGQKQLRMEYFYREMRRKHGILMNGTEPLGGQWNYDADNRKPPRKGMQIPAAYSAKHSAITREVISLVARYFSSHFGELEPFYFAVTRPQALAALRQLAPQ